MAFWNRKAAPKAKPNRVEIKAAMGSMGDPIRNFLIYGAGARTPAGALDLYENSTAVFIPINRIATLFSTLEPVLEIGGKKVVKHPLLDLLRKPCPEFSRELFFQTLAIYYLVTGEAFVLMIGPPNGKPVELYPISPANVMHFEQQGTIRQFNVTGNFLPGVYQFQDNMFLSREGLKQLVQIRAFNPDGNSMLRGRSKLATASNTARQQILGVKHNLSILENGGRVSLVFHFDNDLEGDDFEAVKQGIIDQFSGASNAGQVLVTAGGKLSVDTPGMSNVDMDWTNAQRISFETLLLTYDLPLALFTTDASTYDNYRAGLEAIYDDAVIPLCKTIYGMFAKTLFDRFGLGPDVSLTFDQDKVTALVMRRNNEVKLRKEIGIETDNELRGLLGREAYVGGDVMYKPSSEIPIGTDVLTTDDDITDEDEE